MATSGAELGDLVTRVVRQLRLGARGSGMAPHQLRALRSIAQEPIRPARLAEALGITPRAVTDVVDALLAAGLITSEPDPADRRAKILTVTPEGEARREEAKRRRDETAEAIFQSLDEAERATLEALLQRVLAGADDLPDPAAGNR
jgi:DNA-binding MarR family transcriptional regulator